MARSIMPEWKFVLAVAFAVGLVAATAAPARGQTDQAPTGAYLFRTYCASCHGANALGDGPLAPAMRRKPANLTEILKRNQGVFPADQVFRIIDGRSKVPGHGGADMPVWGDVFKKAVDGGDPEAVKARIEALVAYLQTIQQRVGDSSQQP